MSNLFQRLASQQLDPGTLRVRPMASLPYQAVPEFTEDATNLDTGDGPVTTPRAVTTRPGSMPTHPSKSATSTSRHPSAQPQRSSVPAPLLPTTDHASTATPSTDGPTYHGEPQIQATTGITTYPAEATLPLPSPLLMEIPAAKSAVAVSNEASSPAADPATHSPDASTGASADSAAEGLPAPLLPRQRTAKATGTAPNASPEPRGSAGAAREESTEPNEVHVHIGRIEVTAIQESPQPKSRRKHGQAPMTLDDYLAKRQRGGT